MVGVTHCHFCSSGDGQIDVRTFLPLRRLRVERAIIYYKRCNDSIFLRFCQSRNALKKMRKPALRAGHTDSPVLHLTELLLVIRLKFSSFQALFLYARPLQPLRYSHALGRKFADSSAESPLGDERSLLACARSS